MENKNIIICVGRQLGSGGHDIAKLLAAKFNCKFYDRELLNLAAQESGFSEKFFEQNDEQKGFMKTLFHVHMPFVTDTNFYSNNFSQENLFKFQSDAIRKAAAEGPCVFVGRCAEYVLRDFANITSVFVTADPEERGQRVAERHHCDATSAQKLIAAHEKERETYYNYYTGKQWGDSASYDLCINSSVLGIEGTAELIAKFIEGRTDKQSEQERHQ